MESSGTSVPYIGREDVTVKFLQPYSPYDETNWLEQDDSSSECDLNGSFGGSTTADRNDIIDQGKSMNDDAPVSKDDGKAQEIHEGAASRAKMSPNDEWWLFKRQRRLLGIEKLMLQGMQINMSQIEGFTDRQLSNLAGNMFHKVCCAAMLVSLFSSCSWAWGGCP